MNTNTILLLALLCGEVAIGKLIMTLADAITQLNNSVSNNSAAIDAAIAKIGAGADFTPAIDALVQASVAVDTSTNRLNSVVNQ